MSLSLNHQILPANDLPSKSFSLYPHITCSPQLRLLSSLPPLINTHNQRMLFNVPIWHCSPSVANFPWLPTAHRAKPRPLNLALEVFSLAPTHRASFCVLWLETSLLSRPQTYIEALLSCLALPNSLKCQVTHVTSPLKNSQWPLRAPVQVWTWSNSREVQGAEC